MAEVNSNIKQRQVTLKNHYTQLVRWTLGVQMQNLFMKNSLCFMEIIIFRLLSCLYFYDSGIEVPVNVRK